MKFEDLLESIYVGKLNKNTNNNIYLDLSKETLVSIRDFLRQNPDFTVINPTRNGMRFQEQEFYELRNIGVDFARINVKDLLSFILYILNIDLKIDYNSYEDLLLFLEVLKRKGKGINLHLFNVSLLDQNEQRKVNNLLFLNLTSMCMQVYLEEGSILKSKYDEKGREIIEEQHFNIINVESPKQAVVLKNEYDKKAS